MRVIFQNLASINYYANYVMFLVSISYQYTLLIKKFDIYYLIFLPWITLKTYDRYYNITMVQVWICNK